MSSESTNSPSMVPLISMSNLAVHARIPVAQLRTMIYAYPTFYRGALDALG